MPAKELPARPNKASEAAVDHGFDSWPTFAKHVEALRIARAVESLDDPVASFVEAACVPRDGTTGRDACSILPGALVMR